MKAMREQVFDGKDSSIVAFSFRNMQGQVPYHFHPELELTLITGGHGQRLIGDHLGRYEPGDLVLMGANLPHTYIPSSAAVVLQFPADCGGGVLQHATECRELRALLSKADRGLYFGARTREKVAPLLKQMPDGPAPKRLVALLQILDLLSQDAKAEPLASPGFHPNFNLGQAQRVEKVCQWIAAHLQEPFTLEEAAKQAHMTPAAFSRFFHRATHRTFVRFVNEMRVGHASRLLLETNKTVAEIAFASGFENLSNFNRRFREFRQTTPRDYRAKATGGSQT